MGRSLQHARNWLTLLESSTRQLYEELAAGHSAPSEAGLLRRIDAESPTQGTKPLFFVRDGQHRKFVLKVAEPALMAAEAAASELRLLGGRPTVPSRIAEVEIEGVGRVRGLLKPYLELPEAQLGTDSSAWTALQRAVMLREQAWEWFLDNLDTNTSQYALLGPHAHPMNIDWDRSYASAATAELSRFAKYRGMIPNARTFLYADFVEGKTALPFALLLREGKRIRQLPAADVRAIVERFAAVRFEDAAERAEFVARVLARQREIEWRLARFVRDLEFERIRLSVVRPKTLLGWLKNVLTFAWNHWQAPLHWLIRGPIGNSVRRLLKALRGARVGLVLKDQT